MIQTPRLLRSNTTGAIYIVTKYESLGDGRYRAKEKYDVTKEFDLIVRTIETERVKKLLKS